MKHTYVGIRLRPAESDRWLEKTHLALVERSDPDSGRTLCGLKLERYVEGEKLWPVPEPGPSEVCKRCILSQCTLEEELT